LTINLLVAFKTLAHSFVVFVTPTGEVTMGAKAKLIAGLTAIFMAPAPVAAQTQADMPAKPKLIVAISVDQLSADLFAEYRTKFTGGFKRLSQGVVFPSGFQSHAATETCPGHATILTGARPARNGIVANDWINPASTRKTADGRPDYGVYCAEDTSVPGSTSDKYTVSPVHLKSPTLGDRLKAKNAASRVVAVAGKDRAAVMMGGQAIDQAWWWQRDGFATYADRKSAPPPAVAAANQRATALIAKPTNPVLSPQCRSVSQAVSIGNDKSVGTLVPRKPGDARAFRTSSEVDQLTLDIARGLVAEMKLGAGAATDVLAVGLSTTDIVGHSFGTAGAEMCNHLFALDAMLGRFLTALDATGVAYAVVLTADHGGHDLPERNRELGIHDAQRVDPALAANKVGEVVSKALNLETPPLIGNAPAGDIYLSLAIPPEKRAAARDAAMKVYREHPQVEAVIDGEFLGQLPAPSGDPSEWLVTDRARASYQAGRSGDFLVVLKPRVTPIPSAAFGYVATHGSAWDYDRRVPIIFWQKGIKGFEQPNGVEVVDILPTLAPLIDLEVPAAEIDGQCRDLIRGPATSCKLK
jgi:predicted AlkP superfamily pyrophosphatase or phosphodiesterase